MSQSSLDSESKHRLRLGGRNLRMIDIESSAVSILSHCQTFSNASISISNASMSSAVEGTTQKLGGIPYMAPGCQMCKKRKLKVGVELRREPNAESLT